MKTAPTFAAFSTLLAGVLSLASCASVPPQEETALIQSGFHTVLPETVSERNAYEALPPYTVQRTEAPGHPVYAYYDKGQKVTYVGEAADFKRYKALAQQKGGEETHPEMLTAQATVKTTSHSGAAN